MKIARVLDFKRIADTFGNMSAFLRFHIHFHPMTKKLLTFSLALLAVIFMLYAGLNGLTKDHSYGFFFTFIGAVTTIGLALDVVNHLRLQVRKSNVRKFGRF